MFSTSKSKGKKKTKMWKTLQQCGEEICLETSMHGFNHIAEPRRHWTERILWVGVLCVAIWGMAEISLGQLQRYQENPTVVTLEKDFRTWNFSLPAVTACDEDRVDPVKLARAINARWNVSPEDEMYQHYSRFVRTVANSDLYHLEGYEEFKDDAFLNIDLQQLVVDVANDAHVKVSSSLNINAKWFPVMTEAGVCHAMNSLAIADVAILKPRVNDSSLPVMCTYSSMSCYVMFEAFRNVDYYVHSPYDVADVTAVPCRVYPTLNKLTELRVQGSGAGAGVRELAAARRRCLYTDEPAHSGRLVYSTNTCRLACRRRLAVALCGCTPFYYFYDEGTACSVAGMRCLAAHAARLANFDGVRCACSQQCVDALYREISTDDQIWGKGLFQNKGSVRFTVQAPRTRYTREIVFHFQDLVVSFGGAAGLFLGASFISFVELGYFLVHHGLRLFLQERPVTVKKATVPFETTRIREITSILEENTITI